MIDTIILELKGNSFTVLDYKKFNTVKDVVENTTGFHKWVNNPTLADKKADIYKPRLTLFKRGEKNLFLKIEFSAPKLVFGNNLQELCENDFSLVVQNLKDKLLEMGVIVFSQQLEGANVIAFHPSKNIRITNGFTSTFVIRELSKIDISQKFDIDVKEYMNCGLALQFYTRLYAICIYDKINDYSKPKRRAIDKDQTGKQRDFFEVIKKKNSFLEILRIEVRLIGKKKINELLQLLGFNKNPNFKDIFKKDVCQKVIINCWERIFDNNLFIFMPNYNPQKVLESVLIKNPSIRTIKAISITGLALLAKDKEGIRGLRQIIDGHKPKKTNWQAVKRYLRGLDKKIDVKPLGFVKDVESGFNDFSSIKFKDLQCKEK